MHLLGEDSIAECMAFPKTLKAADIMLGTPAPVSEEQLKELGLRTKE
jgi:aspartyl-tRNA synthetase